MKAAGSSRRSDGAEASDVGALDAAIARIVPLDEAAMAAARDRQGRLTKPPGSLGRLEEVAVWMAGVRGNPTPRIDSPLVLVAAADHGVAAQGVSAYPQEVTAQMMANFVAGGAAVCVLARRAGARLTLVDAGIAGELPAGGAGYFDRRAGPGTNDMTLGAAMTREQAEYLVEAGVAQMRVETLRGADALVPGDMGIGNTTAAAALTAALLRLDPGEVAGPGTGVGEAGRLRKADLIGRALRVNEPDPGDALDVLSKVGGFEIAFLAGAMLGAAASRLPVLLDGFITGAAALVACRLAPGARDYMMASHRSAEPGHRRQLEALGLEPLFDLRLRLGEGSGGALALPVVASALALHAEMATFDSAGVSGPVDGAG